MERGRLSLQFGSAQLFVYLGTHFATNFLFSRVYSSIGEVSVFRFMVYVYSRVNLRNVLKVGAGGRPV